MYDQFTPRREALLMATNEAQVWKGSRFSIARDESAAPATIRFRLSGPFTARDMYGSISPADFRGLLAPAGFNPTAHIFDLSEVPYMDSTGLGLLVTHYSHCQRNGIRLVIAGATPRVLELFQITKVDTLLQPTS